MLEGHFDEAEAFGGALLRVEHDGAAFDVAVALEEFGEIVFGAAAREVEDDEFHGCMVLRGCFGCVYSSLLENISNYLAFGPFLTIAKAMDEMMITLQTIVGHQEEEIANLSQEVYTQQKELNRLKQQMAMVLERFRALQEAGEGGQEKNVEPPPPHY